ncbi:hypothetical protein Athai_22540 [Actinocatenispora thailandica]|uniref:Uncharacterized protein n=1 Tax=Actinocatenispora thailandica TaxID=227318 RepID=A0A7R7DNC4_9ACTN|nr:hypothetical protein Athai_22540 [Actinocatenispora thailandica]
MAVEARGGIATAEVRVHTGAECARAGDAGRVVPSPTGADRPSYRDLSGMPGA